MQTLYSYLSLNPQLGEKLGLTWLSTITHTPKPHKITNWLHEGTTNKYWGLVNTDWWVNKGP